MSLVLDSSMALTWCLRDQADVLSQSVFQLVEREGAIVPGIWHIEMANILIWKRREGILSPVELAEAVSMLHLLKVQTDEYSRHLDFEPLLALTAKVQLTTYDALYVDLARRTGLPLATFDKAMREAARQANIPLITTS